MFANIKLEQDSENELKHKLTINGQDFSDCACRVELEAGSIPHVEVCMKAEVLEYCGRADVKFDFSPKTIQQAAIILKTAIRLNKNTYNAFVASVRSVFDEVDSVKFGTDEISRRIVDRIIG